MEQSGIVRCDHHQQVRRIDTQFIETRRMDMAAAFLHGFAAEPEQWLALCGAKAEQCGKASAAADVALLHEQFVKPAPAKTAMQSRIDRRMSERCMIHRCRSTAGFEPFQLPLQAG